MQLPTINARSTTSHGRFEIRRRLLVGLMLLAMSILVVRACYLTVYDKTWLQQFVRYYTVEKIPAYRGVILDRHGEPLAISTPVQSVKIDPRQIATNASEKILQLGQLLGISEKKLTRLLEQKSSRVSLSLKRQVNPDIIKQVKALQINGIGFDDEYKRFYPAAEVTGHLLGFTNIDDEGQEGIERFYDQQLKGVAGRKKALKDGKGRIFKDIEYVAVPVNGRNLTLTIDKRIQYLAYRELYKAYNDHQAIGASMVVLDAKNGEVIAAVNQPGFNPNQRSQRRANGYRNRAMLDIFEPGSTVKPFVIAAALDGAYVKADAEIDTEGLFRVGRNLVRDSRNYGPLHLVDVLKKSSNVAISKIALKMPADYLWGIYRKLGFGQSTNVGFPSEASGVIQDYKKGNDFQQATLSFGYGLSVSLLQLAKAYTALADDGVLHSVTLLPRDSDDEAQRIFSASTARRTREMLEHVVERDGTAYRARIDGFRVAGKTGTVKKAVPGGYAEKKYLSLFVGMVPASNPRFVAAVLVDEPRGEQYYGGLVAAPVFSKVMAGALRVYGVSPDQEETMPIIITKATHETG